MADCPDRGIVGRACDQVELQGEKRSALIHLSDSLPAFLDELDDFRLPSLLAQASDRALPPYIPQIEPRTPLLRAVPGTAALALSKFVSRKGRSYAAGIERARLLRERGASVLALVGTSLDPQLEAVWKEPEVFISALQQAEVDIVLGPAFSIYLDSTPLERCANRSRSLDVYRRLREAGIDAIPAAGFVDAFDAAHVGGWVSRYRLRSIFVDLQSADAPKSWGEVRAALPELISRAPSLERVVINGVAHPPRVFERARLTAPLELVLTNANAFQLARSRRDYFVRGERFVKQRSASQPVELFWNLARFYGEAASREGLGYIPLSLQPLLL